MNTTSHRRQAVELLQQLGLKEYEAKSFVALARRGQGTAKDISEISDVPRTRVYDAIRVLEAKGLVETQHSNPQMFRAVGIDEAVNTLQSEFVERGEELRGALGNLEPPDDAVGEEVTHEVWALTGDQGITSRTEQLIDDAEGELIIVIGHPAVFTEDLAEHIREAQNRDVDVIVGAISEDLRAEIKGSITDVEVFVSGLEWLSQSMGSNDDTEISRLLLVDREAILVSSFVPTGGGRRKHEQAVFGRGFDNGLVTIVRRLMATGLVDKESPGERVP